MINLSALRWIQIGLFLLVPIHSYSESYKISGEIIPFENHNGLLVHGCGSGKCKALELVRNHSKINLIKHRKSLKFVGSIGSDVCKLVYQGRSVLGIAESRDQRAFCLFKDGSMIETNSLGEYLVSKKIVNSQ